MSWTRLLLAIPFVLLIVVAALELSTSAGQEGSEGTLPRTGEADGRLFVIIVDSMRPQNLDLDELPFVAELSQRSYARRYPLKTCIANYSVQCLQTLLEGRESPFGADITRFTGTEASADGVSGLAQRAGKRSILLSYHEMVKLYGPFSTRVVNTGLWAPDHLQRDIRVVDETVRLLGEVDPGLVILHIDGTDKAAHYKKPGTDAYREHYRIVDGKIRELCSHIDFAKDFVVFAGDHGHNADGNHTRQSVVVLAGERFVDLLDRLALPDEGLMARDLLFFYGYAMGTALPEAYEGAYFGAAEPTQLSSEAKAYLDLQQRTLAARGYGGKTLGEQAVERQHDLEHRSVRAMVAHLPLLLCYLGMLLWWQARREPKWRWGAFLSFGTLAVVLTQLGAPSAGLWLAVPVGAAALYPLAWPHCRRRTAFIVALFALATTIGFFAGDWTSWFHNYGGLRPITLVFFAGILVVGAALAWLRDGSPSRTPWGALAYCMFCLPSGVYYYHSGQNMLHGFAFGLGGLLLFALVTRPRQLLELARRHWHRRLEVPVLLFAICTPLLFMQGGGAWRWNHLSRWMLDPWGRWPILLFYYPLGLLLLWRLGGSWPRRAWFAAVWVMSHLVAVEVGDILVTGFVTAQIPLVLYFAWDELQQSAGVRLSPADEPANLDGLLLFGALLTGVWFVFSGFNIDNIDYTFTDQYLGWVYEQKNRFLISGVATLVKYGCPTIAALTYLYLKQGPERTVGLLEGVLFFLLLKLAVLLAQSLTSALGTEEKLNQLAAADMVFVVATFLTVSTMMAVFIAIGKVKDRRLKSNDAAEPSGALRGPAG